MNGADWRLYFSLRIFEKKLDSQKINPYFFLVIRKLGQIEKIVSFSERGLLTENNGTIINAQVLMAMEKFNSFKNFKKLLIGGHDEKLKNFDKSKQKSVIFAN